MSVTKDTFEKWEKFLKPVSNKKDYLTAAMEYFMKAYQEGKVDIEFVVPKLVIKD